MCDASIIFLVFGIIAILAILGIIALFIVRVFVQGYLGNLYLYVFLALIVCFMLAMVVVLTPISVNSEETLIINEVETVIKDNQNNVSYKNPLQIFGVSLFEAIKMLAMAFDKEIIAPFFRQSLENEIDNKVHAFFGGVYYATSGFALITTSISVILFAGKSIWAKVMNFFKSANMCHLRKVYYIFSEAKVAGAAKNLGHVLKNSKDKPIVIMYISNASLKTQEGTEYRDALINEGFDVKSEAFTEKLCAYLFKKHFTKRRCIFPYYKREATVYGLFDTDDAAINLATNFTLAIEKNQQFQQLHIKYAISDNKLVELYNKEEKVMKEDLNIINRFKVFVTYQDHDIDLNNNFSSRTMHIVNTLSQYDMVSSEFLLTNPLSDFLPKDLELTEANADCFNVSFFGFGSINRPIFEKMAQSYQTWEDKTHRIHYHIYDKRSEEIVEQLKNPFTELTTETPEGYYEKPFLYSVDHQCNDKDLTSHEILYKHFKEEVFDKPGRFNANGFEIFVVSAANTNQDIKIAMSLREVLLKVFDKQQLRKTYIFVRIGKEHVVRNLMNAYKGVVFKQTDKTAITNAREKATDKYIPVIVFGEDTNMETFIRNDYNKVIKLGMAAHYAYNSQKNKGWNETIESFSWLGLKKTDMLDNTAVAYSIGTKLAILGYRLGKKDIIIDAQSNLPVSKQDYTNYIETEIKKVEYPVDIENGSAAFEKKAFKLARQEHNRWNTQSYNVHRYEQLSKGGFNEVNEGRPERVNSPDTSAKEKEAIIKDGIRTKSYDKTKHICMTTNAGLADFYREYEKIYEGYGNQLLELVYDNDVNTMRYLFDALYSDQNKPNGKAQELLDLVFFDIRSLLCVKQIDGVEETKINYGKINLLKQVLEEAAAELILLVPWEVNNEERKKLFNGVKSALADSNIDFLTYFEDEKSWQEKINIYLANLSKNKVGLHQYIVINQALDKQKIDNHEINDLSEANLKSIIKHLK